MVETVRTLAQANLPTDYESFVQLIQDEYEGLSRRSQAIARYLTQNPNEVALQSIADIAAQCNVHPSSLVRFAQSLGYDGFKGLKDLFNRRLATAAPGFEARVKALGDDLQRHKRGSAKGFLGDLVARDITTLHDLYDSTSEADLVRAAKLLEGADTIYIAGQLRSAPIAIFLRYVLTMLDRRTVLLDADGGLATHMGRVVRPSDVLFAISFRFYAKEVVNIAENAHANNVPVIAISDGVLSPLAKCASVLFSIPEGEYAFSRSLAAPM
ncbi:MAG: MurR/RpiR family transcriptional regulator, partial [Acetobacteraceae bacterium]|nr:MurR/RpiR family transcriptional regulator [Acetobacteraceae bacterium]